MEIAGTSDPGSAAAPLHDAAGGEVLTLVDVDVLKKVLPVSGVASVVLVVATSQDPLPTLGVCAFFVAFNGGVGTYASKQDTTRELRIHHIRYFVTALILLGLPFVSGHESAWVLALPSIAGAPVVFKTRARTAIGQLMITVAAIAGVELAIGAGAHTLVAATALGIVCVMTTAITLFLHRITLGYRDMFSRARDEAAHREAAERELREAHDVLEARVDERTVALRREVDERKRAEREAINASRIKSQFLANMSHELRTPLNAIIGYSEMIMEDEGTETADASTDVGRIHLSATHLLQLIQDILDISKIEAGKMDLDVEHFDVYELVRRVVVTATPLAKKRKNRLSYHCSRTIGEMRSDRTKVNQILLNLLSNACKFTQDGSVDLRVTRVDGEDGEPVLEFEVEDTGIGIDPAASGRLFKPFSQADESTTRKYGGTGLGLAISQRFAEMMGGEITVQSAVGKGSTFTLRLPVRANTLDSTGKIQRFLGTHEYSRQSLERTGG